MGRGTPRAQKANPIFDALKFLIRERKQSYRAIYNDYEDWCSNRGSEPDVVAESVRKWSLEETTPTKPGSFEEFVILRAGTPDQNTAVGMLANAVGQLFPSNDGDPVGKLNRLCGHYEMIRRVWLPAKAKGSLRSVITIQNEGGVFIYRTQHKLSSQYPVDETYEGYVFLFGTSFWIIASEKHQQSVKFLTMHECSPDLLSSTGQIELGRGTLMAVTNRGPNISHPFVMRRISKEPFTSKRLSREQTKLIFTREEEFDKISFDFLYDSHDQTKAA